MGTKMIQQNHPSVVLPMKGPERRTPRNNLERFAYINIEPDNGGSVLNVSEGGLCFRAVAPVQGNRNIRFWFREQGQRIQVEGELVWVDETLRTGGLRFTNLPAEAREPMRAWITPSITTVAAGQASALSDLPPYRTPHPRTRRSDAEVASADSEALAVASGEAEARPSFISFSRGLATGLLVAFLVAAPFLFRSHKRPIGESLIRWGERFGVRPQAQKQSVPAPPETTLPTQETTPPMESPAATPSPLPQAVEPEPESEAPAPQETDATSQPVLPPAAQLPRSAQLLPEPLIKPPKAQPAPIRTAAPAPTTSAAAAAHVPQASPAVAAPAISTTASAISSPAIPAAPDSKAPAKPAPLPQFAPANGIHTQVAAEEKPGTSSQVYLEVGNFKDSGSAHQATDKLAHLGLRATVVEKNHFWTNSFRVVVGPYDDDKAEGLRQRLVSGGFQPHISERGSRSFPIYGGCDTIGRLLRSGRAPSRVQMPVQDCAIRWETYSTHAMVQFAQQNNVTATADGKWVNRTITYERDAFVYRENDDGSWTLLELQFAGMSRALVFGKS